MQKTKLLSLALVVVACQALAQAPAAPADGAMAITAIAPAAPAAPVVEAAPAVRKDAGGSVNTVDELIKIENAKALSDAKKTAQALGLIKPDEQFVNKGGVVVVVPPPPSLVVESVSGVGTELAADISFGGREYPRVKVGSKVGQCEVLSIRGTRVTLGGLSKKVRAEQCPSASWTGRQNYEMAMGSTGMGTPMPSPMPMAAPAGASMNSAPKMAPIQPIR